MRRWRDEGDRRARVTRHLHCRRRRRNRQRRAGRQRDLQQEILTFDQPSGHRRFLDQRSAERGTPFLVGRRGEAAHLRLRRGEARLIRQERRLRRLHLRLRQRLLILIELLRTFECRLRHGDLRLRGPHLRLGTGVVVAERREPRDVEHRRIRADLLLIRGRCHDLRGDAAALLRLVVDRDDRRAVLGGNAERRRRRLLTVGLDGRVVAGGDEAPDEERNDGDTSGRDQQSEA